MKCIIKKNKKIKKIQYRARMSRGYMLLERVMENVALSTSLIRTTLKIG
jgi:hypothetical protein